MREPKRLATAADAAALLTTVDYILLDIDGVILAGAHVFPGIAETIAWLRGPAKKQVRFISNNSTMTRAETAKKFAKLGIRGISEREVITSAYAAALHLRSLEPRVAAADGTTRFDGNVFVIGQPGLHDELRAVALAPGRISYGLELNDAPPYVHTEFARVVSERRLPAPASCRTDQRFVSLEELDFRAAIVGLDFHFSMTKLASVSLVLQQQQQRQQQEKKKGKTPFVAANESPSVPVFVATNEDGQLPVGDANVLLPGAGTIIAAVSVACGRRPDIVCGKPHQHMMRLLLESEGVADASRCLMVGDRLSTDVAFGNGAGTQTMLVLTGAEGEADVRAATARGDQLSVPTYVAASLATLWSLATGTPIPMKAKM